jgi:RHS repeat-associated protein
MLASTWFDPVVGLDLHLVGIAAPPSPVPIPTPVPMPFVGLVFDPAGMAIGAAIGMAAGGGPGLVFVNGVPITNTGTNATNLLTLPHVPAPGVAFVPPTGPGNNAELLFGSLGAKFGGSLGVRFGDIALSCSDPVRLPTSMVIAVPKGAPVFINKPMVPDAKGIAAAAVARGIIKGLGLGIRGGGKLFRAFRQGQRRSGTWARISQGLRKAVDHMAPQRYRDRMKRAICFVTGHPVDVATGRVFTDHVDFELPGPPPLAFERVYSSSLSWRDGPLGFGWSHSLDQAVWCERGKIVYLAEDGREIEFLLGHLPDRIILPGDRVYDPTNRLTLKAIGAHRWEIETADGVVHVFAPVPGGNPTRAKLIRIRSADEQHTIELFYDDRGLLSRVVDSGGRVYRFKHDGAGKLREALLPDPHDPGYVSRQFKYEFDFRGNLSRVVDALDHSWKFKYSGHLLVQETDRAGLSFFFQYDGRSHEAKCVETWGDGGIFHHVIMYDSLNRKTIVEDSLGHVTVYQMDDLGMVTSVMDSMQRLTRYEYDPESGQESAVTDPLGRRTQREYDADGNCVAVTNPDGTVVRVGYERNRPVRVVDECGHVWTRRYDALGRLRAVIDPLGAETTYHCRRGLVSEVVDAAGAKTEMAYDEQKNLCAVRYANGAVESFKHDPLGRMVEHWDVRGAVTKYRYDACSGLSEVEEADGNVIRFERDAEGNVLEIQDNVRLVRFAYGGFHKVVMREEGGTAVKLQYDTEQNLAAIENEAGERYEFSRDACDRVIAENGFDGRVTRYKLDTAGQVEKITKPSGKPITLERDAMGRITCVRYLDGVERFKFRADGALLEAENDTIKVELERDAVGRAVRELQGVHAVARRYDQCGRPSEVSSSLGFDGAYVRDVMGELEMLSLGTGVDRWRVHFTRDAMGLETQRRLPGEIRVQTERDWLGRAAQVSMLDGPKELRRIRYRWRPGTQLAARFDSRRGMTRYLHDARARLVAAQEPEGVIKWRRPDATGNIVQAMEGEPEPQRYGKGGVLLESSGVRYETDLDGRRTAKVFPDGKKERYTWNDADRLVAVTKCDGKVVRFAYDAFGRRVRKTSDEDERLWIWDGHVPLHELSLKEGPITWVFEPGTFTPIAKVQGCRRYGIVTDQIGAPCAVFNEWGEAAWEGRVDVFGRAEVDAAKTSCPWRFPGQYEDEETGLFCNWHRYYDPEAGRFISKDPIGVLGGIDVYGYVPDPFLWIDPDGLTFRGPARLATKWEHIFDRHSYWGKTAQISGKKDIFGHLEEHEIMQVVNDAWKRRKKTGTQIAPDGTIQIRYIAHVKGRLWNGPIEMWLNLQTRTLESAYPKGRRCK